MTAIWDPKQYLKFAGPRLRPALDLLAQIEVRAAGTVYDLGCGPGNLTHFLKGRWPEASIVSIDSSDKMLEAARNAHPDVNWLQADLTTWRPDKPADVLYSNAALQWVAGHETVFPELAEALAPGGVLAVQMPRNHAAPSHVLIQEAIEASPWVDKILCAQRLPPVHGPDVYYDLLRPYVSELNIWESEFLQVLDGENPVAEWVKGTALKPCLDALTRDEAQAFFDDYASRVQEAYPVRSDGKTLFPFRRLFIVAKR